MFVKLNDNKNGINLNIDLWYTTNIQEFIDTVDDKYYNKNKIEVDEYATSKKYSNVFFTFDTETTQIKKDEILYSKQISFQVCCGEYGVLLRTKAEFLELLEAIMLRFCELPKYSKKTGRKYKNGIRTVFYAHNLSFDTFFLTEEFVPRITEQFNIKNKITRYVLDDVLEFRCSLQLTKMSLVSSMKEFGTIGIGKLKDLWDYDLTRTIHTMLSDDEIFYCMIDVFGLHNVILNICDINDCNVASLPHTGTGFTRRNMKKYLFGEDYSVQTKEQKAYVEFVKSLELTTEAFYLAELCYFGGMSDTSPLMANKPIRDVGYWDIASEYPTAQVLYKFPCSSPVLGYLGKEEIEKYGNINSDVGYIAKLEITNLKCKSENPIPNIIKYDDFEGSENIVSSGSRIYGADKIIIYINHVDFSVLKDMYTYDDIVVKLSYKYDMGYLPTIFVNMVLDAYGVKTTYKNEKGYEKTYSQKKRDLNTYYGITAMNPLHVEYTYDFDGIHRSDMQLNDDELIDKYNKSKNRTSFYLWGQYTSSYGHHMLTRGMKKIKKDIIACDTDSLMTKGDYTKSFEELNDETMKRIKFVSELHGIGIEKFMPLTPKGVPTPIGFWESENYDEDMGKLTGIVSKRPKCYIKLYEGGHKFTTAGINGKKVSEYYTNKWGSVVSPFIRNEKIPADKTEKLTHRYELNQPKVEFCDSVGNVDFIDTKFGVTLEPASFEFANKSIHDKLIELLNISSVDSFL